MGNNNETTIFEIVGDQPGNRGSDHNPFMINTIGFFNK
jgi:hypothetical protein